MLLSVCVGYHEQQTDIHAIRFAHGIETGLRPNAIQNDTQASDQEHIKSTLNSFWIKFHHLLSL